MSNLNNLYKLHDYIQEENFKDFKLLVNKIREKLEAEKSEKLRELQINLFEIQVFDIIDKHYTDLNLNKVIYIKDVYKRQEIIRHIIENCDNKLCLKTIIMEVLLSK